MADSSAVPLVSLAIHTNVWRHGSLSLCQDDEPDRARTWLLGHDAGAQLKILTEAVRAFAQIITGGI
jgi:hypothetical protein